MQAAKKCVRCNTLNEPGKMYCVKCGKYLSNKQIDTFRTPTIWEQCNYFSQVGLDKVGVGAVDKHSTQPNTVVNSSNDDTGRNNKNPLAKAKIDTSKMRLIPIGMDGFKAETVNENGEILGNGGTIFKQIKTSHQISILHSPTGWYSRTLKGQPLYNGVPQNIGVQIKLADGDLIMMDNIKIRVEIV